MTGITRRSLITGIALSPLAKAVGATVADDGWHHIVIERRSDNMWQSRPWDAGAKYNVSFVPREKPFPTEPD